VVRNKFNYIFINVKRSTQTQFIPANYHCSIAHITGDSGALRHGPYDGNLGGCKAYVEVLNEDKRIKQERCGQPFRNQKVVVNY
jgi:hypothetical protein